MGTLVLDIETASPFEEPPENSNDTEYYEWFAVTLAYADEIDDTPETAVLFRRGNWEDSHTIDLYQRLFEWCEQRDVDRLLTYNGTWFDGKHLLNWARELDATTDHTFHEQTTAIFENHIDVALAAADEYADELWDDQHYVKVGLKGRERDGWSRSRGLSTRGRGTYTEDKLPVFILADCGSGDR